ncbi:MAG TPA: pyridoxamine 5'-phosphate oxidase family protein [Methylomirabilota bacterium]|nr:pyridoxamine 5'-phosphate oxidase family protein [Methylomirabilota bacterium]
MTIADPRIQQYLATKDIILLATIRSDGSPLITPMWFLHDPGSLTLISVESSHKVRNLRRDPRLHLVAESGTRGDIKGISLRGRAQFLPDSEERRALATRLLDKYHPHLERLWSGRAMPPNRVMFRVTPDEAHSWGLG